MTPQVKQSAREARRLQTRERILGAAIAEFKHRGMAGADVNAIVAPQAWRTAPSSSTSPARNTCCSSWRAREEARMAAEFARFLDGTHDLVDGADRGRRTW